MKLITINSDANYYVYGSAVTKDDTKEGATQLNINASTWTNTRVLIRQGIGTYPAEIADWNSVKTLVNNFHITISSNANGTAEASDVKAVEAAKKAEAIGKAQEAEKARREKKKEVMNNLGESLLEKAMKENG